MAKKKSRKKPQKITETLTPPCRTRFLGHVAVVILLLLGIGYCAALLALQTDGFRSYTETWLEDHLGVELSVGEVRATAALNLVLQDVQTGKGPVAGEPGIHIGSALVRWSALGFLTGKGALKGLDIDDVYLSFIQDKNGEWKPECLAAIGDRLAGWMGLDVSGNTASSGSSSKRRLVGPGSEVAGITDNIQLHVKDGLIKWWNQYGHEIAGVEGLNLEVTPLPLSRRKMTHYFLSLEHAHGPKKSVMDDFSLEMLYTGGQTIVLYCTVAHKSTPAVEKKPEEKLYPTPVEGAYSEL